MDKEKISEEKGDKGDNNGDKHKKRRDRDQKDQEEAEASRELKEKIHSQKLKAIKGNCGECPFFQNGKCKVKNKKNKCGCEKPEFLIHVPNFTDFGYCKNCHHFIIRFKENQWLHYNRAYNCKFPYSSLKCEAPIVIPKTEETSSEEKVIPIEINY